MARQYWPERLEVLPELPRTASGKIQKFELLRRERLRRAIDTATRAVDAASDGAATWWPACGRRSAATAARSPPSARTTWPPTRCGALTRRLPSVDWAAVDDVVLGCANQAGEDNRNVARMAVLLAGLPVDVPGTTVNRLCGSRLDAVAIAARAVRTGDADLVIAGGVESMTRAPFVMPKAGTALSRTAEIYDTTIGWRFVNPVMRERFGTDSMPETAENVAERHGIARADQDLFALRSQERAAKAIAGGRLAREIVPVPMPQRRGEPVRRRRRRAPAGHLAGGAGPPAAALPGRHRHRRELVRRQRRRRRGAGRLRGGRAPLRPEPLARVGVGAVAGVPPRRSWASVRCPRPGSCSPAPGSTSPTSTWSS